MNLLETANHPSLRQPAAVAVEAATLCRLLQLATAAAFGVPLDEMRAPSRRAAKVAFARQSAMYLSHVMLGLNYSAVGLLFHRDRTTAAYACKLVEDRRDDPAVDRLLQKLEDVCGCLGQGIASQRQTRP